MPTNPVTAEEIAKLERLAKEATPPTTPLPWFVQVTRDLDGSEVYAMRYKGPHGRFSLMELVSFENNRAVADYAVAAANLAPRLAAELREARERENELDEQIATAADTLNTWCRESDVEECRDPYKGFSLRATIQLLNYALVRKDIAQRERIAALEAENAAMKAELEQLKGNQ